MAPSKGTKKQRTQFTTIKVSEPARLWIKLEAARREVPMYALIEQMVAAEQGRRRQKSE